MASLDTNIKGATAAEISLTSETLVSLYLFSKSGAKGAYRVGMEFSPDGVVWVDSPDVLVGPGVITIAVVAVKARAKVFESQGAASTVTVLLLAR